MKLQKLIFWNVFILICFLGTLEILARTFFPEFKNRTAFTIKSEKLIYGEIYSKKFFKKKHNDIWISRVKNKDYKFDSKGQDLFVILGDSITNGFGMPYEDIYWVKMQKKVLLDKRIKDKIKFVAISDYGNDLNESIDTLVDVKDNFNAPVKHIMYQFNLNDLRPPNNNEDKNMKLETNYFREIFNKLQHSSISKSVFINAVTHYMGSAKRNLKNCGNFNKYSWDDYSFTFGSKGFEELSKQAWTEFENQLENLKLISDDMGAELAIFISPLIYDIDINGIHKYHSPKFINYDCATIDPRAEISQIANKLNIKVFDPKDYLKKGFDSYIEEGNFEPFFYTADPNHFNSKASEYIADYLYFNLFNKKSD